MPAKASTETPKRRRSIGDPRKKLFFFSEVHFDRFVSNFQVEGAHAVYLRRLVEGVYVQLTDLNERIEALSENWNLTRMPVIDRCTLRIAAYELIHGDTPERVVINEAIELAKKYSTEHSGAFVNGILDKLSKSLKP